MGKNKVIVRIFGGLGNQLFCYAAARRLALVNKSELIIDNVSGFVHDQTYRRSYQLDHFSIPCYKAIPFERLEPFSRVRRIFKKKWNQQLPFARRSYIQQKGIDFDPRLLELEPEGTVHLDGYWQSENYFKDVEETIRQDLRIKPLVDADNSRMAAQINGSTAVAVHMRFFDDPREQGINNAPGNYYDRAIRKMDAMVSDVHYFVFSDKPEAARERLPLPAGRFTLVNHNRGDENAYADLWLMSLCRHFIIANSTFSWWGAWLAGEPDKKIIAPGFEMREGKMWWGFKGLLPENWIKL